MQVPKSWHCDVDIHQRQGKKSKKSEEKERDRGMEGETPNTILGN